MGKEGGYLLELRDGGEVPVRGEVRGNYREWGKMLHSPED